LYAEDWSPPGPNHLACFGSNYAHSPL
jgi:hypothetical protein